MKSTPENLRWFSKNLKTIKETFRINEPIPETLPAFSIFIQFFDTKEEFNNLKNWEGTPWEDSPDVYAELSELLGCVAEIDGKFLFVDHQVYEMYLDEIMAMAN